MQPRTLKLALGTAAIVLCGAPLLASAASAHADADVVAVASGEEATINFRPNHGCDDSPTTEVAVRVPAEGATGGDVDGWKSSAEGDGNGNTIVEWTGGSLPADATGAFPVTFTVPMRVGELLVFPAVQTCANGEELGWLNGDPDSDNPAPRLLILPAGSAAATSIDEVSADAPGRELLTAVVDTSPTTSSPTGPDSPPRSGTTVASPSGGPEPVESTASEEGSGGSSLLAWVLVGGAAVGLAAGGLLLWRRENRTRPTPEP
jgi:uncharacterized protein YcnI